MIAVPRVVVTAPSSGHGRTAVAIGLLAAFASRGLAAAGFKVGPDHTDAAYLGAAAGRPGRNLDPLLVGTERIVGLFGHGAAGADIAVLAGTMGLFDSLAGQADNGSTATVAAVLRAPVVLVVDAAAMGQSIGALVHGFRAYDEMLWLGGVILNRVGSDRHEQVLRDALDDIGVPVLGVLRPGEVPAVFAPRQQGMVPVAHRDIEAARLVRRLGETVADTVDLDRVLGLARSAPRLSTRAWSAVDAAAEANPAEPVTAPGTRRPLVAVAGTNAVPYGYVEMVELLGASGAAVVPVDPLRDESLPEGTDALVIAGGLPEGYAEELSANRRLRGAVADLARSGRPVLAEGAGLLWLVRECDGRPMCGVLDAAAMSTDRAVVGYREATARSATPVAPLGARLVGYKQHRTMVRPRAGQSPAWSWGRGTPEGFVWRRVHASQLTLHWAGAPEIARRLVAAARPPDGGAPPAAGPGVPGSGVPPPSSMPVEPLTVTASEAPAETAPVTPAMDSTW